jgi:hypothetical protein
VDPNASGDIMFPNFLCLMSKKFSENNAEDEIREAFRVFDSVSHLFCFVYGESHRLTDIDFILLQTLTF